MTKTKDGVKILYLFTSEFPFGNGNLLLAMKSLFFQKNLIKLLLFVGLVNPVHTGLSQIM